MRKEVTPNVRRFWGIGNLFFAVMTGIETAYFTVFLTDAIRFPLYLSNTVMIATSVIDFILAPFAGVIISSAKAMRWGRIRSWVKICPPLIVLFYTLEFAGLNNAASGAVFTVAAFTMTHLLWNLADAANISLISVIAPAGPDRLHLNSRRMMGSSAGRMLASYLVPYVLVFYASMVKEQRFLYMLMAFTASMLMWLGFFVHYRLSAGYETADSPLRDTSDRLNARDILQVLTHNKHLLAILISDLTSNVGAVLLPTLAVYYYNYVLRQPELLPIHMLATGLGQLAGSWLISKLARDPAKKKPLLILLYLLVTGFMISVKLYAFKPYVFIAAQTIMNVFVGMTQPMEADLYIDTAIYHEYRTGKNALAFIVGLMAVPVKVSVILKSVIVAVAFAAIGYKAGMDSTPALQEGLINAYIILPAIIPLLGAVSILFFYKLNPKKVEEMQKEIQRRRQQQADA